MTIPGAFAKGVTTSSVNIYQYLALSELSAIFPGFIVDTLV
jgi:hypothetical protein